MIGFGRTGGLSGGGVDGGGVVHWHGVRVCMSWMAVVVMEGVGISGVKSSVDGYESVRSSRDATRTEVR